MHFNRDVKLCQEAGGGGQAKKSEPAKKSGPERTERQTKRESPDKKGK